MKKCLILCLIALLTLNLCPMTVGARQSDPEFEAAQKAVESAIMAKAKRLTNPWTKYLLSQPIEDFICTDNSDLTGFEATFSIPAWSVNTADFSGDTATWLDQLIAQISATRIECTLPLTAKKGGGFTVDSNALKAFASTVAAHAKSAESAFDRAAVRQALMARFLPRELFTDGEPTQAFAELCHQYEGVLTPAQIEAALSTQKNATMDVKRGPSALRVVFYSSDTKKITQDAYADAAAALLHIDLPSQLSQDEIGLIYSSRVAQQAHPFVNGSVKGNRQEMFIDFGAVLKGDFKNAKFESFAKSQTKTFQENLPNLAKTAAGLPDYPARPQPETGMIQGGSDTGTQLTFIAADDGFGRFVTLYDDVGSVVASLFLRSGGNVLTFLPEGEYTVHSARGDTWYGTVRTFGEEGDAFQSAAPLTILDDLHLHTITLGAEEGNTEMMKAG